MTFRTLLMTLSVAVLAAGCKKELDSPPERTLPVGSVMTIAELKALFTGQPVHFPESKSVYAVVTADENDGNFYKNISVQDGTGGITLRLLNSGGLYIGDSVRIYLPGTVLAPYNNLMQLDSVDVDNNIVKQATLVHVEPLDVNITDLTVDALDTLQSRLIRVNDVEFIAADAAGGTWANAVSQTTGERFLEDCDGNEVMVRTSGYSNYAGQALPTGRGSIVCIAGIFGNTIQLTNRSLGGVNMNGPRCPGQELPFFVKNFDDMSVSSGGWTQQNVIGDIDMIAESYQDFTYGKISNFVNGSNQECETWYISPVINLTGAPAPKLNFRTAAGNFAGPPLEVFVTTDYIEGLPATANWTPVAALLSPGSWDWVGSGNIDLTPYNQSNTFRFAYKYVGTNSNGKTYEIDDIQIIAQ